MPQSILDCLFLLRRAMRDNSLPFTDVVVLPPLYTELSLHLRDVERRDLVSVFFADIGLYFIVCSFLILNSKFFDIQIYADMSVDFFVT